MELTIPHFREHVREAMEDRWRMVGILNLQELVEGTKEVNCWACHVTLNRDMVVEHFREHIEQLSAKVEKIVRNTTMKSEKKMVLSRGKNLDAPDKRQRKVESRGVKLEASESAVPVVKKTRLSSSGADARVKKEPARKLQMMDLLSLAAYETWAPGRQKQELAEEPESEVKEIRQRPGDDKKLGDNKKPGDDKQPGYNKKPGDDEKPGDGEKLGEQQEVARQLAQYVKEGSKEYRHETKKARDRLYKRLKRDGRPIDIKKHQVEAEMLNNFIAKLGHPEQYWPSHPHWWNSLDSRNSQDSIDSHDSIYSQGSWNSLDSEVKRYLQSKAPFIKLLQTITR